LLDENLSERLVPAIAAQFPDALHVRTMGLGGASDSALCDVAVERGCILVTKDEDFVRLSVLRGPSPKIIWLNVGNVPTATIATLLVRHANAIEAFAANPELAILALG
jgi:predicted nuclease of predicted toxin-antitoxin system